MFTVKNDGLTADYMYVYCIVNTTNVQWINGQPTNHKFTVELKTMNNLFYFIRSIHIDLWRPFDLTD